MNFELFVAKRYLLSRRKQSFISVISLISVLGVAIGVAALVVVMGVYNGFTAEIREMVLGYNSHVILYSVDISLFDPLPGQEITGGREQFPILERIEAYPIVKAATPFLSAEVMISTSWGATGLVLRGVDPGLIVDALPMLSDMKYGSVDGLYRDPGFQGAPGILVGQRLADRYGIATGSRVNLLSPAGTTTTTGFSPKIMPFRVEGIFESGLSEYDQRLAYTTLAGVQELMGLPAGRITGIEIYLNDPYAAQTFGKQLSDDLGLYYYTSNWIDQNANLFAAFELERIGMFLILAMVILVASFSIITSLVMLVMEKTKDIAILMSMGATGKIISRIFTLQGIIIGAVGTGLGYVLGLLLAWLLKKYQFIDLPPGVFILDRLPVLIDVSDTVLIGVASILMCFLATIYPSRKASRLQPSEALRYE